MNCTAACLIVLLAFAAAGTSLASGSRAAADRAAEAEREEIIVAYSAPLRRVVLTRDLRLADTEDVAEYSNPAAAEPSAVKTVRKEGKITEREAAELLRFIRAAGFFQLKPSYGGAPEERNYPYLISVRDEDKEKLVAYYSRPDAEPRPSAFAETERKIIELAVQNTVELNSGGKRP